MRIKPQQLLAKITNKTLIFIAGDEHYLVTKAVDDAKTVALAQEFSEVIKFDIESNSFAWQELKLHAQHQSLFDDKKLIQLRINTALNKSSLKELLDILQASSDVFFIITHKKLTKAQEKQALFQWLERQGLYVLANPIPSYELPSWTRFEMRSKGLETSNEGYALIAECTQGNLSATASEIEKLALLFGKGSISLENIRDSLTQHAKYSVFELADEAVRQQPEKALSILDGLRSSHGEPVLVLWAVLKEIKTLASMRFELDAGKPLQSLFQKHRIWQSKQSAYASLLKKTKLEVYYQMMADAKEIDKQIKGLSDNYVWPSLSVLCFRLASASQ